MKSFLRFIGILRLYSLTDFILLLIAFNFAGRDLVGAVLLWVGFLFLLESQHKHEYRMPVSLFLAVLTLLIGLTLLTHFVGGLAFVLLSYLYTQKNKKYWGVISPFIRALQPMALIGGILYNPFVWLVGLITLLRNFLGDVRDVSKDKEEGLKTLPVLLGIKAGNRYAHLVAVMLTTTIWWIFGDFNVMVLIVAWLIEVVTYNLTPRNLQ